MKKTILIISAILNFLTLSSQTIDDLTFGTDTTLEVVTWNIENFPKNGQTTLNYVKQIIENTDVDIYAFQEIEDTVLFKQMLSTLPQYQYYFKSSWYAGLAYIYKPDVIQINNIYEIFTTSPYWSPFPRSPMVLDINYSNKNFIVINNHLKCCGDGILNLSDSKDEETRRYVASNLLKDYIDTYFSGKRVFVVGDLNDEITDSKPNNVFINIINDSLNYQFADMDIALGNSSGWSYPTWPSHLDHILITNEMFIDFQNGASEINVIKIDKFLSGGWYVYETNISDHRPVGIKIQLSLSANTDEMDKPKISFSNYPNPFSSTTTFCFDKIIENSIIEIYNSLSEKISTISLTQGQSCITWDAGDNQPGIYIVKLISDSKTTATTKIMIIK